MDQHGSDIVIIGAGCAGLSLAWHLVNGAYPFRKLTIIDQVDPFSKPNRYYSFWDRGDLPFSQAVHGHWERIDLCIDEWHRDLSLSPYHLHLTDWKAYVSFLLPQILADARVSLVTGKAILDKVRPVVKVGGSEFEGDWIFDGSYPEIIPAGSMYMHTSALRIVTEHGTFDPQTARFLDYRRSMLPGLFHYVLPLSAKETIVESAYWADSPTNRQKECRAAIHKYLEGISYTILEEQYGIAPLFQQAVRKPQAKVLRIGISGGRIKPSTGYGLTRIWEDSRNILKSLQKHGHPFILPREPWLAQLCDKMLLGAIRHNPQTAPEVYRRLFQYRNQDQIWEFLDGYPSLSTTLSLMAKVTPWPFAKAYLKR